MKTVLPRLARTAVSIVALVGIGCGSTCSDPVGSTEGVIGELGNGNFEHICLSRTDAACGTEPGATAEFPMCLVRAGVFDLRYTLIDESALESDASDPILQVTPANGTFLGRGPFVALRTGRTAVIVTEGDQVIDLLHMDVFEATEIEFTTDRGETLVDGVQLGMGETVTVFVRPHVDNCFAPGGALPLTMRTNLGLLRSVVRVVGSDALQVTGVAQGSMTVEVHLGELVAPLTIVVDGVSTSVDPSTSDDASTSDASTSAGTGPSTDTDTDGETATDTDIATGTASGGSG